MKICVFLGPSLLLADAERELDATYLPPVSDRVHSVEGELAPSSRRSSL